MSTGFRASLRKIKEAGRAKVSFINQKHDTKQDSVHFEHSRTTKKAKSQNQDENEHKEDAKSGTNWKFVALAGSLAVVESVALVSIRKYVDNDNPAYLVGGVAGYSTIALILPSVMRQSGMGAANIVWNAFSSLAGVAIGAAVFDEEITTKEAIGIPLIVTGSMLLSSK